MLILLLRETNKKCELPSRPCGKGQRTFPSSSMRLGIQWRGSGKRKHTYSATKFRTFEFSGSLVFLVPQQTHNQEIDNVNNSLFYTLFD